MPINNPSNLPGRFSAMFKSRCQLMGIRPVNWTICPLFLTCQAFVLHVRHLKLFDDVTVRGGASRFEFPDWLLVGDVIVGGGAS